MEFLFTVFVITIAYFAIKAIRGPLPPREGPPVIGGQPYNPDEPKGPQQEE
jgi:hypothetical protein